jgi:hypothetical protein
LFVILYHFTFVAHVFPILGWVHPDDGTPPVAEGIKPAVHPGDDGKMVGGQPVVWLTSRSSLVPTPADLDCVNSPACPWRPDRIAYWRERGTIDDRTAMLTVDLSPNSKRLRNYGRWVREQGRAHYLEMLLPSTRTDWWVYFGTISRDRVQDVSLTAAPASGSGM